MRIQKNKLKTVCRASIILAVQVLLLLTVCASAFAALPQKGSIAILVKGPSEQHAASTASIVIQQLIAKGYKVVDENKLASLRRAKAASLALQGDVDAIMNLSRQYGFSTMLTINVQAGKPVENEFKLFTGTASLAVLATASNGSRIYADTTSSKQVGYSPDEAAQKSIESASRIAVEKMTQ